MLSGNPGSLPLLSVMFFYPILFLIFSFLYQTDLRADNVLVFFKISSWSLVILQLGFILSFFGADGQLFYDFIHSVYSDLAVIDAGDSHLVFTLPNVSSLLFLLPFVFSYYLFSDKSNSLDLLLVCLMFIIVILSGRRAFFVSVFISLCLVFILAICFGLYTKKMNKKLFILAAFVLLCISYVFMFTSFELRTVIDNISSIIDFESNVDNIERVLQFYSLFNGYADNPLLGLGAGAVGDYIRSPEQPWAYELFYLAFLFQYGTIGSLIFLSGICYILFSLTLKLKLNCISVFDKTIILCVIAGVVSFLIANGSNPYLAKFDYMWIVFFPLYFNIYISNIHNFQLKTLGNK
ncbi:O-antigen ligase family protein [Shewanella sp. Isolate8]|uniref:O-antigen ligase family protein n=1 Tax=Shewanella sp. Isolate8 TaxID=2908529 RepID=UPI001EFCB745|nr:O-antigen ligase family protein [Shewanella sp. Isolate8]MCG9745901.1 O-antigen ligase family protein [Shewanella sp. Isolate8]